jgi:hypothetical protein
MAKISSRVLGAFLALSESWGIEVHLAFFWQSHLYLVLNFDLNPCEVAIQLHSTLIFYHTKLKLSIKSCKLPKKRVTDDAGIEAYARTFKNKESDYAKNGMGGF